MTNTNNTEKAVRITKANRFEDVKILLTGGEVKFGTTIEEAVAFIDKEMELLSRKNSKKTDGAAFEAIQAEREEYKNMVLEYLATVPQETGATCADMIENIPMFREKNFQTSKVSTFTTALAKEGRIVRLKPRKGRTPFALA